MPMIGYLDESGTHGEQSPATIMACFMASPDQWALYQLQLSQLLAAYGVSVFHARKFRHGKGDFRDWERKKKERFNAEFLRLADDNMAVGLCSELSNADYKRVYRNGSLPRKARPDTRYGVAFRICLWKAIVFMRDRPETWPLTLVLEDGHANAADAVRIFQQEREGLFLQYRPMLDTICFASKKTAPPLAAVDMLAYSMFRMVAGYTTHAREHVISAGPADPPYIVAKVPMTRTLVTPETLEFLRAEVARQALAPLPLAG